MNELNTKLSKITVKPKQKLCDYCGKLVNYSAFARHTRTKRCQRAKVHWEIQQCQQIIQINQLRIIELNKLLVANTHK